MEHEKFADILVEMSFVALLAIALQTSLQMQVLSVNNCWHKCNVFSLARFCNVITFVRISKIMLSFLSQVIVKLVDVSFNPYQPNDEFHI